MIVRTARGEPDRRRRGDADLPNAGRTEHVVGIAGATLIADPAGVLYWPDEKLLVVADLHLEKGSAYAVRGVLLPPYDTATTLARLAKLIERYRPGLIIALGDSFHDGGGPARTADVSRAALRALQRGRDWLWIVGNHDPELPCDIGGAGCADAVDRFPDLPARAFGEIL